METGVEPAARRRPLSWIPLLVLFVSLGPVSAAQQVEYRILERSVIEERLLQCHVAKNLNLPIAGIDVGESDADSFSERKIPSICIHSVTQETLKILHSNRDTPAAIQMEDYYNSYRLIAAYLATLDTILN